MTLSIIIPYYHNPKNLSRCLKSLANQTILNENWGSLEIIVVDDGSDDSPRNYADDYAELRGKLNVKFFKIAHSGAAAARNFGFSKSSGEYIFFCDSDVVFLKNDALEKMVNTLNENPDKAYCYSSFKYGWKTFKLFPFDAEKLKENNYISTMSMVRRAVLKKIIMAPRRSMEPTQECPFDESLKRFQDWDLWLTLLEHGETGIFIDEILWQAKNGGTISHWLPKMFYKFPFLKKIKEYNKAKEVIKKKHNL